MTGGLGARPVLIALAAALLASCGAQGTTGDGSYLGPDTSFAEAGAIFDQLDTRVQGVFDAEGVVPFADRPSGSATYRGVVEGISGPGASARAPEFDYYAEMVLHAEFDGLSVSGSLENFVTTMPGFEKPEGTITLESGPIRDIRGELWFQLDDSGTLSTDEHTATVTFMSDGSFGGTDASVVSGSFSTEFSWREGPNNGETSSAPGELRLE